MPLGSEVRVTAKRSRNRHASWRAPEALVHAGVNGEAEVVVARVFGVDPGAAELRRLLQHVQLRHARLRQQVAGGAEARRARPDHAHASHSPATVHNHAESRLIQSTRQAEQ